jgi:hypothetical protein
MKKEFKQELINHIKNAASTSKELQETLNMFIEIQQLKSMNNIHINISVSQNYRNETKYYAAKTFFPIGVDEEKVFRVYVGKVDAFKNGANDEEVMKIAKKKLLNLINDYRHSVKPKSVLEL